jgi:hypothetical protein
MVMQIPRRPWPRSAASHSAPPKAGSRRPAPADSSHQGAADAPDDDPGQVSCRTPHGHPSLPGTRGRRHERRSSKSTP